MDPVTWSVKEWAEVFSGPLVAVVLLALNLRGTLWWKPQVDKLLATTVEAAAKLDEVRVESIDVERADKNAWKSAFDELKKACGVLTGELADAKQKVAMLTVALEDERRRNRLAGSS